MVKVCIMSVAMALGALPSLARDNGQWVGTDPAVREWYRTRTLTPAAEKRIGFKSCCDHSDVVKTQFRAGDNRDQWLWLNGERWEVVPPDIIHWGDVTPTGEPVLFAVGGRPTCFFPGTGGI